MSDSVSANRTLRERERELRQIIEMAPDAYVSIDEAGLICAWNAQAEQTFGWRHDEIIGRRLDDTLIPARLRQRHRAGMTEAMRSGDARALRERVEVPAVHKSGRKLPIEVRMRISNANGMKRVDAFMTDISDRKALEHERQQATERLQLIADGVPALVAYFDESLTYRWSNRMYHDLLGLIPQDMIGKEAHYFFDDTRRGEMHEQLRRALKGETVTFEIERTMAHGARFLLVKLVPDVQREIVRGVFSLTVDITERKQHELRLSHDVSYDVLTGLLNRRGLFKALEDELRLQVDSPRPISVTLLDLDHFKQINDSYGHPAGDAVLSELGRRLSRLPNVVVGRLGGDEFVLVERIDSGHIATESMLDRTRALLEAPVHYLEELITVSGSLGTYQCPVTAQTTAEALVWEADRAMYEQKRLRRTRARRPNSSGSTSRSA